MELGNFKVSRFPLNLIDDSLEMREGEGRDGDLYLFETRIDVVSVATRAFPRLSPQLRNYPSTVRRIPCWECRASRNGVTCTFRNQGACSANRDPVVDHDRQDTWILSERWMLSLVDEKESLESKSRKIDFFK